MGFSISHVYMCNKVVPKMNKSPHVTHVCGTEHLNEREADRERKTERD